MPRALSPSEAAARLEKWAKAGINVAIVDAGLKALDQDKRESQTRAPHVSGRLAATIRVIKPSATRAGQSGVILFRLGAGKRSGDRRKAVPYARVLQTGTVWHGGDRARPHDIVPRAGGYSPSGKFSTTGVLAFKIAGRLVFAKVVHQQSARFHAHPFLDVNQPRFASIVNNGLQASADREIG